MSLRSLFKVTFVALGVLTAAAQESIQYASISGRVADATGAVIQNAKVSARQIDTNISSALLTDKEGRFRFPYLKVGEYEVRVQQVGFANVARSVTLSLGSAYELPVVLAVASAETNVTVTGEVDLLETARTQIAGTVSQAEVRSLPLNGRSFLDLALLVPGVSPTNTASNQLFAETSAVPGQGISVGSQRNFSNNFIVDGLSANDDAAGLSGIFFGLDMVQEFQVVTSGGQAELGRALGGYINMVTKSGTNALHGDLYGYVRNQRLNAANPLSNTKLPLTQAQYGASLGGPVVRDRTFYFANFEQRALNQSGLITIAPANVSAINARLAAIGYQGAQIATGLYPNPVHNTNFLAKVDHQFGEQRSVQRPLQPVRRPQQQLARRRRIERGQRLRRPGQHRPDRGRQQCRHALFAHRQRNPRTVHPQQPRGAPHRPHRPRRQHFRRRLVWHALRLSHRPLQ